MPYGRQGPVSERGGRALQDERRSVPMDHFRAAGASDIGRDQLALDRRGGQPLVPECDRKLGQPREIACKGARRLRARTLAAVHIDGKAEHEGGGLPLGGKGEEARGIGGERLAGDGFDRGRESPVGIARRDADRLGAEVEADQRAAGGQMRRRLGQGEDQCRHRRWVTRVPPRGQRGSRYRACADALFYDASSTPAEEVVMAKGPARVRRKLVEFDEETWQALDLLGRDSMKTLQELADEAFRDLLRKYDRPTDLKAALKQSARSPTAPHAVAQNRSRGRR